MNIAKLFAKPTEYDAVLIVSRENRLYFTGFSSSFGYLIVTKKGGVLITDTRYIVEARAQITDKDINVELALDEPLKQVYDIIKQSGIKAVAIEDDYLTFKQYNEFLSVFKGVKLYPLGDELNIIRSVKTEYEIEQIVKAQSFAEIAYSNVIPMLKSNVTERDIATELDYQICTAGASGSSFDTIVAFGVNSAKPHAVPTNKKLKNGDLVLMDFGAKYNGYCSDMTRTLGYGDVDEQLIKIYDIVLEAHTYAMQNIKAGITCCEADSFARECIIANGFGKNFGHSLGHGVGLCIHELPTMSKKSDMILLENMVITIEPAIYIEGLGGVRIENMAIVKKDGLCNLTKTAREFKRL